MKPSHILLGSALLLALFIGMVCWQKFTPVPDTVVATKSASSLNATVEQPMLAPTQPLGKATPALTSVVTNDANATVLAANHQETLNSLLKFQTELEQSLAESTDPQEREALQQELDHLQIQIQFEINASATRPMITTQVGKIALVDGQSVQQKLASGDAATFTSTTAADGTWTVNVIVRHDTAGNASVESTTLTIQPGQATVVKVTGNEIHFTPAVANTSVN